MNLTNLLDTEIDLLKMRENIKVIEYNTCQIELMILTFSAFNYM